MELVTTKAQLREARNAVEPNSTLGLVPTMGGLHEGHLSLVDAARSHCSKIVATIFVNPLQFGPSEDFESYPRALERDSRLLEERGVDILFAPSESEMYPSGKDNHTLVALPHLTDVLCGRNRPGHFDGVATVVSKLFNLVQPQVAYFGEKDWQQVTLIRALVGDLDFPIKVIGVPTFRDNRGLALSSRNSYLSQEENERAPLLHSTMCRIRDLVLRGQENYADLEADAIKALSSEGFDPDYISIREGRTLRPPNSQSRDRRVFGAARLGETRLIDNLAIDP